MKHSTLLRRLAPALGGVAAGYMMCLALAPEKIGPGVSHPSPATPSMLSGPTPQRVAESKADIPLPVKRAQLTSTAYTAAGEDLSAALTRARNTEDPAERQALLQGIFAWVAQNRPPAEAIRLAREQEGRFQKVALGAMVWQWSGKAEAISADADDFSQKATEDLFFSPATPRAAADAWLAAFSDDPGRAAIAIDYAGAYLAGTPDKLFALAKDFTPWERERFLGSALAGWGARGEKEAGEAISWVKENWDRLPAAARAKAFSGWAAGSPDKALEEIAATGDASRRMEMIPAVAAALGQADTEKAVAWAESLSGAGERESAHAAIYEAVPRGIGVMFKMSAGMPYLEDVMPGGAAATAGLIPGDRLVSVTGPEGNEVSLYGANMTSVAENLRGESGETVRIRILRTDPSGVTSELVLPVTRQQLVMK